MKRTKAEYENDVNSILVGRRLAGVRYFEIRYHTDKPNYQDDSFQGHHLDYGCDLEMEDGSTVGIVWDGEFFQYGIGILRSSLSSQLTDFMSWDVTANQYWAPLIGKAVNEVKVYWSWARYEGREIEEYPQDLEVAFEDGSKIYLSASQYNEETDTLWGMSDDVAVVFSLDIAKRYCIGPYADNN